MWTFQTYACGNFYYDGINIHLIFLTSFQLQSIGFQVYTLLYCLKTVCYHFLLGLWGGVREIRRGREDFPLLHVNRRHSSSSLFTTSTPQKIQRLRLFMRFTPFICLTTCSKQHQDTVFHALIAAALH